MNIKNNNTVNMLMGKIHRAMRRVFDNQLKKFELTPPQFEALLTLWEEDGLVLSELGRRLSRDGPTITGIIDRMERKQIVERKRGLPDRRSIQVVLTPKALSMKKELMEIQQEAIKDITKGLSHEEIRQLEIVLEKILTNIEKNILPRL